MERTVLIDEIINFGLNYGLLKNPFVIKRIRKNIEKELTEVEFVENLYNTIFSKAKERKVLRQKRIKDLLMELEKLRLELEDKTPERKSTKC